MSAGIGRGVAVGHGVPVGIAVGKAVLVSVAEGKGVDVASAFVSVAASLVCVDVGIAVADEPHATVNAISSAARMRRRVRFSMGAHISDSSVVPGCDVSARTIVRPRRE